MHLSDTMPKLLLANTIGRLHNTLNINGLGNGIAWLIIHDLFLQTTCSDAFAKCLIVLLKLPKACVHV